MTGLSIESMVDTGKFIWLLCVVILLAGARVFLEWLRRPATVSDPWDGLLPVDWENDAQPVCHHCFQPAPETAWFCPHCGAAEGALNNWMVYVHVFSIGEVLRTGTTGAFRLTRLNILAFVLFSLLQYSVFAPIYWIQLARNVLRLRRERRLEVARPGGES